MLLLLRRRFRLRIRSSSRKRRRSQDTRDSGSNRLDSQDIGPDIQVMTLLQIIGVKIIVWTTIRLCDRASRAVGGKKSEHDRLEACRVHRDSSSKERKSECELLSCDRTDSSSRPDGLYITEKERAKKQRTDG